MFDLFEYRCVCVLTLNDVMDPRIVVIENMYSKMLRKILSLEVRIFNLKYLKYMFLFINQYGVGKMCV